MSDFPTLTFQTKWVINLKLNSPMVKEGELQMRVRFVCFVIIFFGVSVLITGCGEEDITEPGAEMPEPEEEIDEPEDPCL